MNQVTRPKATVFTSTDRTTGTSKLYDHTSDRVILDEIEKIGNGGKGNQRKVCSAFSELSEV